MLRHCIREGGHDVPSNKDVTSLDWNVSLRHRPDTRTSVNHSEGRRDADGAGQTQEGGSVVGQPTLGGWPPFLSAPPKALRVGGPLAGYSVATRWQDGIWWFCRGTRSAGAL